MSSDEPISGGTGEHGDDLSAASLGRFGTTLRRAPVWEDPPDDLGDRIIAQIGALRVGDGHVGDATPSGLPARDDSGAGRRRGASWVWPGLAVAAAALVAFAAGALLTGDDDDRRSREPMAVVALTATDLSPGARAEGDAVDAGAGFSINIDVSGLPPAPIGEYYEGWLHDPQTGDWVSVGTFHMRDGDGRVVLWSGVELGRYNELVVTSEVKGSTGGGHGDILLEGQFQPR
jgi:Anti-sigma-K factor rskA